jgi:decaprenylphospho-beta-D-erythro-pentofuranosid-2-ulose 2-reductase
MGMGDGPRYDHRKCEYRNRTKDEANRMALPWTHAIVVGGSSGIGEELVKLLASGGCRVAAVARREAELRRVADSCGQPDNVLTFVHDVTCCEEVPALFQQICRELGGLDLIIYAAGIMPRITPEEYSLEKDRAAIEVNFTGAVAWINQAAERFGRAGDGTIVGISSVAGDRGRGGYPVYGATKAALNTYLESIRNRVGRLGVAVITVKPGPVDTPMTKGMSGLPMVASPAEVARTILLAAARRARIVYVPWKWRPVMLIIRAIPSFLFQRMKKLNS